MIKVKIVKIKVEKITTDTTGYIFCSIMFQFLISRLHHIHYLMPKLFKNI